MSEQSTRGVPARILNYVPTSEAGARKREAMIRAFQAAAAANENTPAPADPEPPAGRSCETEAAESVPPRDGEGDHPQDGGGGSRHRAAVQGESPLRQPSGPTSPGAAEEATPERIGTADWTVFTPERQAAFLEQLTATGEVRLAARAAGVSPQTAYRARCKSPAFALAWDAACLAARPIAEDALATRAVDGFEEPVFYRGEEIARRRRYDARLLLAHLARLDKLAERAEVGAALPLLDEVIARLRAGRALDEARLAVAPPEEPSPGPGDPPLDRVPGVPSSSAEGRPVEPCPDCGGRCDTPGAALTKADCQWLGNRLERMEAARPRDALPPHQLAIGGLDCDEIETLQLEAFEAGLDRWWKLETREALDAALAPLPEDDPAAAGNGPGEDRDESAGGDEGAVGAESAGGDEGAVGAEQPDENGLEPCPDPS